MKLFRLPFLLALLIFSFNPVRAQNFGAYNEIAADIPIDGGGMLMLSRLWGVTRYTDVGFVIGGGVINRDFKISGTPDDWDANTQAGVLPFIGPRISVHGEFFGVSIAYGAFYARTKFEVDTPTGKLTGHTKGWGTGFHAPLLVFDFYDRKSDMMFGFGLGSFLGTSYPDLVADNGVTKITSKDNPINTITVHGRVRWMGNRQKRLRDQDEFEN